ncbi:hypothetical protein [Streptomyces sp. F001]|uniref:hypothetical protein n=1 Tax=Streptomyces sp. F001 TaxID=1510026 RepID=UPI001F0F229D|nr:hypothetical protein [Streptomyces sp. F001]
MRPEIPHPLADYVLRLLAKTRHSAPPLSRPLPGWPARRAGGSRSAPCQETNPAPCSRDTHADRAARRLLGPREASTRRRMSPRAILALAGLALFATAVAVGTSLTSGDNHPTTPAPGTTPPSSVPAPGSEVPSPTPSAFTDAPTLDDRQGEEEREQAEQEQKKEEQEEPEKKGND